MENAQETTRQTENRQRRPPWLSTLLIMTNLAFLVVTLWAFARFGSIHNAIRFAVGERITVDAASKSFGTAEPGQRLAITFLLANHGASPIRVLGSTSDCSCTVPGDMPFVVNPGQSRPFHVALQMPQEPQGFSSKITLYTSSPDQLELDLVITGEVVSKSGPKETG